MKCKCKDFYINNNSWEAEKVEEEFLKIIQITGELWVSRQSQSKHWIREGIEKSST